jgi:hypothetical protein
VERLDQLLVALHQLQVCLWVHSRPCGRPHHVVVHTC